MPLQHPLWHLPAVSDGGLGRQPSEAHTADSRLALRVLDSSEMSDICVPLPLETRATLTGLIVKLILGHAGVTGPDHHGRPIMISDKVRPHHLERKALLYVRQSSAHQVLHNRERCVAICHARSPGGTRLV